MKFNRGDLVVHHSFGVGTVITIETKNDGNEPCLYYRIDFGKTSVWVKVQDQMGGAVRPITPRSDLARYRELLKSSPEPLDGDFRQRQIGLMKRIDAGTYKGVCEIVRDLSGRLAEKPLTQYEKTLLKQTRAALISEWSVSSGLSSDEARLEIDSFLSVGGKLSTEVFSEI